MGAVVDQAKVAVAVAVARVGANLEAAFARAGS